MSNATTHAPRPNAGALLHLGTNVEAEVEQALNRWSEKHVTENLSLPGFIAVRRFVKRADYQGTGESPKYLTLYQLEDASALESEAYAAHDQSIPDSFSGHMSFQRSVYRELSAPSQLDPPLTGAAILHVTVDVERAYHDSFLKWYAEIHVPAVLEVPGMIGARRFENVELEAGDPLRAGQHTYCTIYEMQDASVIGRPEIVEAARKGACPADLEPHRVAFNHVYEEIFSASNS
jgi:hypothetical protein